MEKRLGLLFNIVLYLLVGLLLTAAVAGAITRKPVLLSIIRSNSMYPLLQRGDAVFIRWVGSDDRINIGDIVIFRCEKGSLASKGWIMHRVVDGNAEDGYITKGDANEYPDQASGGAPPIKREWIVSRALTVGSIPLKLPLVGYLPLWLEGLQKHPMVLPGIAVTLAAIVGASEFFAKKKKRNRRLEQQLLYFFSGLTLAVILAASMLATSQQLVLQYEVSPTSRGVMMGTPVGVLQQGEVVERPLSELNNKGFFPTIVTVTTADPQVSFSEKLIVLSPGEQAELKMKVTAREVGQHKTSIWVGIFFPLLPPKVIYYLAKRSYWLALAATSLLPPLPLMLLPVLEPRLRRRTQKEIRRALRRVGRYLPFPF